MEVVLATRRRAITWLDEGEDSNDAFDFAGLMEGDVVVVLASFGSVISK